MKNNICPVCPVCNVELTTIYHDYSITFYKDIFCKNDVIKTKSGNFYHCYFEFRNDNPQYSWIFWKDLAIRSQFALNKTKVFLISHLNELNGIGVDFPFMPFTLDNYIEVYDKIKNLMPFV